MLDITLFDFSSTTGHIAVVSAALGAVMLYLFVWMIGITSEFQQGGGSSNGQSVGGSAAHGGGESHGGSNNTPSAKDNYAHNHNTGFTVVDLCADVRQDRIQHGHEMRELRGRSYRG
jgi:hypothetical protein